MKPPGVPNKVGAGVNYPSSPPLPLLAALSIPIPWLEQLKSYQIQKLVKNLSVNVKMCKLVQHNF